MSDTANSEMSRMHDLSVQQGRRVAELEAELSRLQARYRKLELSHESLIRHWRENKAELEAEQEIG